MAGPAHSKALHLALITSHNGRIGGMEKFARFVADAVLRDGGRITVALSGTNIFDPEDTGRLSVETVNWVDRSRGGDREYIRSLVRARQHWFQQVRPDVALFIQSSNTPFRVSVLGASLAGVPIVSTHRTMPYVIPHVPSHRHLLGLLPGLGLHRRRLIRKTRLTARVATRIVYNSLAVQHLYEQDYGYPPEKGYVIRNAVSWPEHAEPADRNDAHARLYDRGRPIQIGFVGRLGREKRLDVLLEAAAALHTERATRIIVYGNGPEREKLEAHARELGLVGRVQWRGETNDPAAAYDDLDIVALCSPRESSSNMILEAMAAGKAVVVTNTGGMPELVDGGSAGLIVPALDVPALTAALTRLVTADGERIRLGKHAQAIARVRHDPACIASQWVELLAGLARGRKHATYADSSLSDLRHDQAEERCPAETPASDRPRREGESSKAGKLQECRS
jgi:glycosyltransferase involved in cell wall biosynthesis